MTPILPFYQWAAWDGVRQYEAEKHDYLQGQIGNPGTALGPLSLKTCLGACLRQMYRRPPPLACSLITPAPAPDLFQIPDILYLRL